MVFTGLLTSRYAYVAVTRRVPLLVKSSEFRQKNEKLNSRPQQTPSKEGMCLFGRMFASS